MSLVRHYFGVPTSHFHHDFSNIATIHWSHSAFIAQKVRDSAILYTKIKYIIFWVTESSTPRAQCAVWSTTVTDGAALRFQIAKRRFGKKYRSTAPASDPRDERTSNRAVRSTKSITGIYYISSPEFNPSASGHLQAHKSRRSSDVTPKRIREPVKFNQRNLSSSLSIMDLAAVFDLSRLSCSEMNPARV